MKIEAEKSKYHGDAGWVSDPQLFVQVAVTWQQWIGQAGEHLHAAQLLLPHMQQRHVEIRRLMEAKQSGPVQLLPSLDGIYFLHCALSIENAFKCVIAARFTQEITDEMSRTRKVPKVLLGHDLVELAARADFHTGIDEEYTLTFLSRYGTWAGRYPIPLRNADNGMTDTLSDGSHYMTGGYNPDHVPAFVAFCGTVYSWARAKVQELSSTKGTL